jgi:hypothetical protein
MAYEKGDVPVARAYLEEFARGNMDTVLALLRVWAEEMGDVEKHGKRARELLFGLNAVQ